MNQGVKILGIALCTLALAGCVNREQADEKLAKGCIAGVKSLLPEGEEIQPIKSKEFTPATAGPGMRHVKLVTANTDGWVEEEQTYECIFEESFGFLSTNYTASIYQIRLGEEIYGKSGNEIRGSFEDFVRLTDGIREAMYD